MESECRLPCRPNFRLTLVNQQNLTLLPTMDRMSNPESYPRLPEPPRGVPVYDGNTRESTQLEMMESTVSGRINTLTERIHHLADKLHPVLTPETPSNLPKSEVPFPVVTRLDEFVGNVVRDFDRMTNDLEALIARVHL